MLKSLFRKLVTEEVDRIRAEVVGLIRTQQKVPACFIHQQQVDTQAKVNHEHELIDLLADNPYFLCGYVDLSDLRGGDKVEIREYVTMEGRELLFFKHELSNQQEAPVFWLPDRMVHERYRVTLKQVSGQGRRFLSRWYRSVHL